MASTLDQINLDPIAEKIPQIAGDKDFSIAKLLALDFKILVPIAGAIFLVLLLYGGVTYMTAAGNEEQTGKAKKIITQAIIGIIIVAFSFGVGLWILKTLKVPTSIEDASTTSQEESANPANGATSTLDARDNNNNPVPDSSLEVDTGEAKPGPNRPSVNNIYHVLGTAMAATPKPINTDYDANGNPIGGSSSEKTSTPVVLKNKQEGVITVGTHTVIGKAAGYKDCRGQASVTGNGTFRVRLIPNNQTGNCSIKYFSELVPTPGTVTITTLDSATDTPIAGLELRVKDSKVAEKDYLRGKTNAQGATSFEIHQPGPRTIETTHTSYISCNNALYLSAGTNLTLWVTNKTNTSVSNKCDVDIQTPKTSETNSDNLPQPSVKSNSQTTNQTTNVYPPVLTQVIDISNQEAIAAFQDDCARATQNKGKITSMPALKDVTATYYCYVGNFQTPTAPTTTNTTSAKPKTSLIKKFTDWITGRTQ